MLFVLHIKKIVIPLHPLGETHSEYAVKQMRNFRASEWESLLSHNERSQKSQVRKTNAEIAQLVEHNLAKVGVASSSLVFRSNEKCAWRMFCEILIVGEVAELVDALL